MKKNVILISSDVVVRSIADKLLKVHYDVVNFSSIQSALDHIYYDVSNLLIIDIKAGDPLTIDVLNNLKNDPMFNQMPVLAILSDDFILTQWDSLFVEDYIWSSHMEKELINRASLCIARAERTVEMNPLTRLPGNISITRQIQFRLDEGRVCTLAHADIDHFKPFNDKYGFGRGDEIIKITGRLILNIVKNRQQNDSFIGHIGGDDFIFIMDRDLIEDASQEIISAFDKIVPTFYDPDDREQGHIQSTDRRGNVQLFDIMTLSIGITTNNYENFSHYGEISERASEMKRYAKQFKGSCFRVDRRKKTAQ